MSPSTKPASRHPSPEPGVRHQRNPVNIKKKRRSSLYADDFARMDDQELRDNVQRRYARPPPRAPTAFMNFTRSEWASHREAWKVQGLKAPQIAREVIGPKWRNMSDSEKDAFKT